MTLVPGVELGMQEMYQQSDNVNIVCLYSQNHNIRKYQNHSHTIFYTVAT